MTMPTLKLKVVVWVTLFIAYDIYTSYHLQGNKSSKKL